MSLLFRPLFDAESSTWTYLLGDGGEALIIDPVFEQHARDLALIRELGLTLKMVLETHVHADHVTGAWLLKRACGAQIAVAERAAADGVDRPLCHGDKVAFGGRSLEVRATPGHTDGCLTFVLDDRSMAFTGDALLIRGAGRTDFQQGDARSLYRSITEQIFSLPDQCLLYPAHDYSGRTVTTVAEERAFNPRVGGQASEGDFVGYMQNLGLPHPKKMDEAVPANLRCGRPDPDELAPPLAWCPAVRTYAGLLEVDPAWVAENRGAFTLLDVREAEELEGELGAIGGAVHIALGQLRARTGELPAGRPVVAVCRSGRRSAQATVILAKAGFSAVNLAGGMLRWRELGVSG